MGKENPPEVKFKCYYCGLDVSKELMLIDERNQCIAPVHIICFNEHKEEME